MCLHGRKEMILQGQNNSEVDKLLTWLCMQLTSDGSLYGLLSLQERVTPEYCWGYRNPNIKNF